MILRYTYVLALAAAPLAHADSSASHTLKYSHPAKNWEKQSLPIGNGTIGATVFGGVKQAKIQFTVDSLWTGDENPSGSYSLDKFGAFQSMGELTFDQAQSGEHSDYTRTLDISTATHTTTWKSGGTTFKREAIASNPAKVVIWRISADQKGAISGTFKLKGAHLETPSVSNKLLQFSGNFPNKLEYDAKVHVRNNGGTLKFGDGSISVKGANSVIVTLAADTNYVLDLKKGWMSGKASDRTDSALKNSAQAKWKDLLSTHVRDYQQFYNRTQLDLGTTDLEVAKLDTNKRIQRYRDDAKQNPRPCLAPELEAMLFNYGRYLLISSSREGTLPANLQGIWNNNNDPAWRSDYHTNINIQMNYWLAETANLAELAKPLLNMYSEQTPVFRKYTIKEYGDTEGFVTRMSTNPFGGGGWNWNIEGTAWLAQHYFEHYRFSGDKEFLENQAYPWLRDVSKFWLPRLIKHSSGKLVVPNAWSHEHGPHEDGTAHAQQLMWDLFTNTLKAAEDLGVDKAFQKELSDTIAQLYGPKVGSWGQLMEWMGEKDLEKGNHRHTSHLYAIFPGNQISAQNTPELLKAAEISLTKRGEVGDSRRSWTWAWRTALWARLGNAERAHGCVAGLLCYNTLDNLWTTHAPFQIDGNFGITAGIAECLLQSHEDEISLLPSLPSAWPTGSVKGLRARGNTIVDIAWENGLLTKATIHTTANSPKQVRIQGKIIDPAKNSKVKVIAKK